MKWNFVGAATMALALAACGTGTQERTTGGAAAGAATGAGIGALAGPVGVLGGAAIGGGVGAVTGATTEPDTVNLGSPPWSNPQARVPGIDMNNSSASSGTASRRSNADIREAQRELRSRGYDVGPIDGIWGQQTASAVREFQRANNIEATGRLDQRTRQAMAANNSNGSGNTSAGSGMNTSPSAGGGRNTTDMAPNNSPQGGSSGSNSPGNMNQGTSGGTTQGTGGTTPSDSSGQSPPR